MPSPTGLELLRDDPNLQNHWIRRVVAIVIDAVIVSVVFAILAVAFSIPFLIGTGYPFNLFPFWSAVWFGGLVPLFLLLYFVLSEALYSRTIGKEIMGLRVRRLDGKPVDIASSFVRNISKIHILLLILDVAAGLGMHGDSSQKFSDRYIGTKVESVSNVTLIPSRL